MLESHENKNAKQKIEELRNSITALQLQSKQTYFERDSLIKEQRNIRQQISSLISQTQQLRKTRDALTAEVKTEKNKRSELNTQIKDKFSEIQTLNPQKKGAKNPGFIKHAINALNKKIETEVISFEKEKQLMKQLHALEKEYAAAVKEQAAFAQKKEVSTELGGIKKSADEIHATIQEKAKLSQENHEKSVLNSKKIDELIKQAEEFNSKIEEKEKILSDVKFKLDSQFKELRAITGEVNKSNEDFKKQKELSIRKTLNEKRAEVEEKFKKGLKLTTEDFLVMQSFE